MNKWEMRKQFGRKPDLAAVLVWSLQKAFVSLRTSHPDSKRQAKTRMRDLTEYGTRKLKGDRS